MRDKTFAKITLFQCLILTCCLVLIVVAATNPEVGEDITVRVFIVILAVLAFTSGAVSRRFYMRQMKKERQKEFQNALERLDELKKLHTDALVTYYVGRNERGDQNERFSKGDRHFAQPDHRER